MPAPVLAGTTQRGTCWSPAARCGAQPRAGTPGARRPAPRRPLQRSLAVAGGGSLTPSRAAALNRMAASTSGGRTTGSGRAPSTGTTAWCGRWTCHVRGLPSSWEAGPALLPRQLCLLLTHWRAPTPAADDSTLLMTAAGDASARLWDLQTGEELFKFKVCAWRGRLRVDGERAGAGIASPGAAATLPLAHRAACLLPPCPPGAQFHEPARACEFSVGEKLAAISTDPFMDSMSSIRIFDIAAGAHAQRSPRAAPPPCPPIPPPALALCKAAGRRASSPPAAPMLPPRPAPPPANRRRHRRPE